MSVPRQLKPNIYSVGTIDWDRRLFDELIPLPDGTSYNAYLIKGGEKNDADRYGGSAYDGCTDKESQPARN